MRPEREGRVTGAGYRLDDLVLTRSVAVVGASQDPGRIGGRPIAFLKAAGFPGTIYPVNAKYAEVQGLRAYPDLESIPVPIDVAVVSVPARDVRSVIEGCARKGVRAAVVFASGFGEVGAEGRAQQAELERLARATGVRVIGPNCQGLVALPQRLNLSFSSAFVDPGEPGTVGLVVQSGAVGGMMATLLRGRGVGLSYWISVGNEADVDAAECIEFFARDAATRVVGAYVESIRDGRRLLAAVGAARAAGKPVVILRAGRSAQSLRAAVSHTGAMAAEDAVARALLAEAGATDARDVGELLDAVYTFTRAAGPRGRRVAILSNSGGLGVIMADTCARLGLELPSLSAPLQQALAAFLPAFGATGNPVDVTAQLLADATLLPRALETLLSSAEIDVLVVALCMVNRLYPVTTIVEDLVRVSRTTGKPVMVSWVASAPEGADAIDAARVPVFTDTTRCLQALAALLDVAGGSPARTPGAPSPGLLPVEIRRLLEERVPGTLDELDSKTVLRAAGVPTVDEQLATSVEEAVAVAEAFGYPVVLKLAGVAPSRESKAGLARLGLADSDSVAAAARELDEIRRRAFTATAIRGLLVQRMAPAGVEMVIGSRRDPTFGPIVMLGLGGVFVEHFADLAFGLAPVTREQALEMARSLRAWPLLGGAPAQSPADVDAVADAVAALSRLAFDAASLIREVHVNPLIVLPPGRGVVAINGLIVLGR